MTMLPYSVLELPRDALRFSDKAEADSHARKMALAHPGSAYTAVLLESYIVSGKSLLSTNTTYPHAQLSEFV